MMEEHSPFSQSQNQRCPDAIIHLSMLRMETDLAEEVDSGLRSINRNHRCFGQFVSPSVKRSRDSPAIQWYPVFFTLSRRREKPSSKATLNTEPVIRFASSKRLSTLISTH